MRIRRPVAAADDAASAAPSGACERKYLYCVIRASEPMTFAPPGVAGPDHPVYTINHRDLAAVVSDSPEARYEGIRRNMTAHMRVLEEVMRDHPILPIRFNSVSPSREAVVQRILRNGHDELIARLDQVAGRIEMGVKAFWRDDALYREIIAEHDDIRRLRDRIAGRTPEATYRERIRLGEMVEKALAVKRERESARMLARLSPLAERLRLHEPASERMALNAALFLKAGQRPALERTLAELDKDIGERIMLKCVGPTPPYNFVELILA